MKVANLLRLGCCPKFVNERPTVGLHLSGSDIVGRHARSAIAYIHPDEPSTVK